MSIFRRFNSSHNRMNEKQKSNKSIIASLPQNKFIIYLFCKPSEAVTFWQTTFVGTDNGIIIILKSKHNSLSAGLNAKSLQTAGLCRLNTKHQILAKCPQANSFLTMQWSCHDTTTSFTPQEHQLCECLVHSLISRDDCQTFSLVCKLKAKLRVYWHYIYFSFWIPCTLLGRCSGGGGERVAWSRCPYRASLKRR